MTLPAGFALRRAGEADLDAIMAMFHAGDVADVGEPDTPRDFIAEAFTSPFVDPEHDVVLVADGTGEVAGFGEVEANDPRVSIEVFVRVHPARAGLGISSALLDWGEGRVRDRLPLGSRTRLQTTAAGTDDAGVALLRSRGAAHVRSFLHMQRTLDAPTTDGPPAGVRFRMFDAARDWPSFHRLSEATFADHFGYEPLDLETFVRMSTQAPGWRPDLVVFADLDGEPIGFVSSTVTETPGLGWVGDLGVLAEHRGRGVGRSLLHRAFSDLAASGCSTVRLNVDADNATGATRIYEKVGMTVRREWMVFEQPFVRD